MQAKTIQFDLSLSAAPSGLLVEVVLLSLPVLLLGSRRCGTPALNTQS